jgi:hypothetical protein
MHRTLEYVVNELKTQQAVDWAKKIMEMGESKETKAGVKYILIENKK